MQIGAHVDQTDPIAEAKARDTNLVQFFLGDPQGYKGPEFRYAGGAEGLKADAEAAGIDLYVHAPYIVNVATTNNRIRIPSRKLLQQHVDAAAAIGAKGLIVHGGHVNKDDDPAKGFDNWRKAVEATDIKLPLLIENTAGGDNAMTRYLERIAGVWDAICVLPRAPTMVGFCLDTCHAHAGGNALETVVDDVRKITGRIDLVHCNDSRDDFDSGADRHANLGNGQIDPDLLAAVVRDAGAPVMLETPGGAAEHSDDIAWLRRAPVVEPVRIGSRPAGGRLPHGPTRPAGLLNPRPPAGALASSRDEHRQVPDLERSGIVVAPAAHEAQGGRATVLVPEDQERGTRGCPRAAARGSTDGPRRATGWGPVRAGGTCSSRRVPASTSST